MSRKFTLFIIALTIVCLQCKDKASNPPGNAGFSLAVTVKDVSDNPVPGLQVSAWNIIEAASSIAHASHRTALSSASASTSILFTSKETGIYRLDILTLDNQRVERQEGSTYNGTYHPFLDFDTLPATVYKVALTLRNDPGSPIRYVDTQCTTLDCSGNPDRTIVGFTDASGTVNVAKPYLFPYLYHLGILTQTNESSPQPIGTFSYTDQVAVVVTDTVAHVSMTDTVTLLEGHATPISIVWNPITAVPTTPDSRNRSSIASSEKKVYLRGDLNCDSVAYQVSDATAYLNFYLEGLSAFDSIDCSIQGSDVNADGYYPSLGDFVYLVRIILGESQPFPKPTYLIPIENAQIGVFDSLGDTYFTNISGDSLGAIDLGIQGSLDPILLAPGMAMGTASELGNTRIVIYPPFTGVLRTYGIGSGPFLKITGRVDLQMGVYSTAGSSTQGTPVGITLGPTKDRLYQNFPNPFN